MSSDIDIIVTLSSPLITDELLPQLHQEGGTIARINGSHCSPQLVRSMISDVRSIMGKSMQIMIDMPGRKIRTKDLEDPIKLESGKEFQLYPHQFNYNKFFDALQPGQRISANDGMFFFDVVKLLDDRVIFLSHNDGLLHSNKGIHTTGTEIEVPPLLDVDLELIEIAKAEDVDLLGLSFVHNAEDVKMCLGYIEGTSIRMVTKIETGAAVANLEKILDVAETILLDRGDLASEIGIDKVSSAQNTIIKKALARQRSVYLATQFLTSMTENQIPLIAELNDIYNVVLNGVHGLQLSEETAIGKYPLDAVKMMRRIANEAVKSQSLNN